MTQSPNQPRGSLSLFPSANISNPQPPTVRNQTPLGRRSESRERRAPTPQQYQQPHGLGLRTASPQNSPPRNGRQTPQEAQPTLQQYHQPYYYEQPQQPPEQHQASPAQQHENTQWPLASHPEVYVQEPTPVAEVPRQSDTAFTELQFDPRNRSDTQARSSIAKLPLGGDPSGMSPPQPLQSIFPTYNPEIALEHQQYMPTQTSPTHIPRAVISRQGNPIPDDDDDSQTPAVRSPDRSAEPPRRWPRLPQQPPQVPTVCTTEQLKSLWRVANGWRASPSEGRVYCLKLAQEKDAPVYTLSSQTQPFWNMRLDPTSASARVTLTRHDPTKPFKAPKPDGESGSMFRNRGSQGSINRGSADSKLWVEALSTTMEEETRRHQPNDGLVALLMPTPASRMAQERADAPAALDMAENECGRLVWDDDTSTYFLVHSALQKPFFISIERSPAWSRTEYTLEHTESPQHLAKLTRDGSGGGWLELDTGLASKIDSFFILDVAVSALTLVAFLDEKNSPAVAIESFEAPPVLQEPPKVKKNQRKESRKSRKKVEEFEIDLESQDDSLGKGSGGSTKVKERKTEDRLPFLLRVVVKLTKGVFKTFIFFWTAIAKMFGLVFRCFYKCIGSKY
ncbi:hypothetical protein NLU13_1218 [Sarocladium strictum]|uniref:Acetylserotonin methytransferase-like protein n=1 Tax=Sarocladium strictum TaxID=5046 RepID=A0AA39GSI0_SARSR|nr:hypothetical protein NLU13_1218 [Sarocladium strictum]